MDVTDHDRALIASAFAQVAERGWWNLNLADAARAADVPLDVARRRVPTRCALLLRFGALADAHALQGASTIGLPRDRLFDVLMRRFDILQNHRAGVVRLLRALPTDPAAMLLLATANLASMQWMLGGTGISATGPLGVLRAKALLAVWLWTLHAWERDTTDDLSPTMAALDQALARAETAESWLRPRGKPAAEPATGASPSLPPPSEGASDAE